MISLNEGMSNVSLLSVMVGLPDAGAYLERKTAGLQSVIIQGDHGSTDFTNYEWDCQVGLVGEKSKLYEYQGEDEDGKWKKLSSNHQPLTWYKTTFDAPDGKDPVTLNFASMGKGEAWVNGQSIRRYWVSFRTAAGPPSQLWYHVPRSFLKPKGNLLILFEEERNVEPQGITVDTIAISKVCGHITDTHLPPVYSWREGGRKKQVAELHNTTHKKHKYPGRRPRVRLQCSVRSSISNITFPSYGNPSGNCYRYAIGSCHSSNSIAVAEKACLGKRRCSIPRAPKVFGDDPCPGV